jgi:hypothetical protein
MQNIFSRMSPVATRCGQLLLIAILLLIAPASRAARVTFWFSGTVDTVNNDSNNLPAGITIGTPFTGRISYETAEVSSMLVNSFPTGDSGNYYFTNTAGFSFVVFMGGHTISNASNPSLSNCGYVGITDGFNNEDAFDADTSGGGTITVDGQPIVAAPYASFLAFSLRDETRSAYNSAALPTTIPAFSQFESNRELLWSAYVDNGQGTSLFRVVGNVTSLSTNEQVALTHRRIALDQIILSWPIEFSGYTLQSAPSLTGPWTTVPTPVVDIAQEHTVTLTSSATRFFRLEK